MYAYTIAIDLLPQDLLHWCSQLNDIWRSDRYCYLNPMMGQRGAGPSGQRTSRMLLSSTSGRALKRQTEVVVGATDGESPNHFFAVPRRCYKQFWSEHEST